MPWVTLLILHGLVAFLLLGAVTHQTVSTVWPSKRKRLFVESFAAVRSPSYANAVCTLWVVNMLLGAVLYANYRLDVRVPLEEFGQHVPIGLFETKEHAIALGLGLLPTYWLFWKRVPLSDQRSLRTALTVIVAACAWWGFLVGNIVNNTRGVGI